MIVEGQIHGGAAQGIGQALMEQILFDRGTGQILTGSFMDYAMPRADDLPMFALSRTERFPRAIRLASKARARPASHRRPPSLSAPIIDALQEFGVDHIDMPATPERIWRALRERGSTH